MYVELSHQEQQIEIFDNEGRQKQVEENSYGGCEYDFIRVGIPKLGLTMTKCDRKP